VTINATPANVPLTINLGAGNDTVTLNGVGGNSGIGSVTTVHGGTGTGTLTDNDQVPAGTTSSFTYCVTDWSIQRNTGSAVNTVNFDNLSQVILNGVPSQLNAGEMYFIGSTWDGSAPALMNKPGAATLSVNGNSAGAFHNSFYIGYAQKYFGTMQTLNVSTGSKGQNAVYVDTLPAGVALNISSSGQTQDKVYLGQGSAFSLAGIQGAINVSNSSGQTSLIVDGTGDPNANYTLTGTTLSVSNGPTITYQPAALLTAGGQQTNSLVGVTSIQVLEGGANDWFDAESAPAATSVSVHNVQNSNPKIYGPAAGSVKVV
jgi:hypothetical protein